MISRQVMMILLAAVALGTPEGACAATASPQLSAQARQAVPAAAAKPSPSPDSTGVTRAAPESLFIALLATGPAYRVGVPPDQLPGFAGHGAHMRSLTAAGTLIIGGPYGPNPGRLEFSGAMLLLRAASLDEARHLVRADPGVAAGLFQVTLVSRWIPGAGAWERALRAPPKPGDTR